jgi:hypothetical protein
MSRIKLSLDVAGGAGTRQAGPLEVEAIVFRCVQENGAWRLGLGLPHHNLPARDRFVHFMRSELSKRSPR